MGCAARSTGGTTTAAAPLLVRPAHVSEPMVSCAEATRAANDALLRLGYTITSVVAARSGQPGSVTGTRDTGWSPGAPHAGELHTATVTITCSDSGSELDAVTDEGITVQLNFPKRFAAAVTERLNIKPVRTVHNDIQPQGVIISVEPARSGAAISDFGLDLRSAGITPVKMEIVNRTARRYGFARSQVKLVTEQGRQEQGLSPSDALGHVGKTVDAAAVGALLDQKQIAEGEIQPGQSLSGYLYFKAAAYQRARVVLTDTESGEPEGFSVDF